ncbi:hypothetical protein [Arthrobacter sp. NicSoilB8]|uniref:hypothetical protein n=1 Tax=Arthrobacter sp. NicSoilB8 TaxID=2830998 RepID=UPI001CC5663A|nr:hypothetical protein [Arthrobacter sp. NicSoilB8]BCW72585.1 hypothetical protein NicSoilB8_36290 [Arthrobacter sp. NicSoilB8]
MSETKSLAAPKASFDRRSVVKGAAWSVPVIAAAIAAPAASASEKGATVVFASVPAAGSTSFVRVGQEQSPGQTRHGAAAPKFTIANPTPGGISGDITGLITITPDTPAATKAPGVGFTSLTESTTLYSGSFSGTTYSGSFTQTGGLKSGGSIEFSLGGFRYSYTGNGTAAGGKYTIAVAVTFPGGRKVIATSPITFT